jgi:methylenetetrahydrofolate dehydrogenase (NADP+)/methenyltetrahydrofolate cyclohydrolase
MVIEGKKLAEDTLRKIKQKIDKKGLSLQLDIVYIKKNPAAEIFIAKKKEAAEKVGIQVNIHTFSSRVSTDTIKATCRNLNFNPNCTGYFIQLPVSPALDESGIVDLILPSKDVDCLSATSLGSAVKNTLTSLKPATVEAIIFLLKQCNVRLKSKQVTVINDSNLIGKPLAAYLLSKGATVVICNKFTKNVKSFTLTSDILITATGVPHLISEDMVKPECIVIDAGISKLNGKTVGDVDFEHISKKVKVITPVPGGVGPLTVAFLLDNLMKLYESQKNR